MRQLQRVKSGMTAGPSLAALVATMVLAQPLAAQSGAGNAPTLPGDSPQSAPTANPALQASVPGDPQTGALSGTTPTLPAAAPATIADPAPQAVTPGSAGGGEIVVTGSRLTNGMKTPTPVTVLTASQLAQSSPNNISDGLARLPAFGQGVSTQAPVSTGTTGTVGQNLLNLRGLGDNRNLVLLDGRRIVTSNQDFAVDINTLPQNIIARVDVVTGGASAAYGSDAVAGVVNFVLDTKFRGLKGDASGGISTYGDAATAKASIAYGGAFLDDRLHVIAGEEYFRGDQVGHNTTNPRGWFRRTPALIPNVAGGRPANLVLFDVRSSVGSEGGVITAGPLRGTQFVGRSVPAPFDFGANSGPVFQSGGDGAPITYGFTPKQERSTSFVHVDFDVSTTVSLFGEFGYSYSTTTMNLGNQILTGSNNAFTIFNDNAYLPAAVKATMAANRITSFRLGKYLADFGDFLLTNTTHVDHEAVGLKGTNLFGLDNWNGGVSYSRGRSRQYYAESNLSELRKLYAASDAVVNPATNQIVCRSQYYTAAGLFVPGGTGADSGCVPLNVLGVGVADPAAKRWINGTSYKVLITRQDVVEAKLSGDLGSFALPAGAVSFAIGGDYRRDKATQTSDALSQSLVNAAGLRAAPASLNGKLGAWRFGNFQPFGGKQTVKEAFGEVGIPILADAPLAHSLTADIAGRYTSYSLAGDVQTWKVGLDYAPTTDLRLRGTVSRDIRAPNLLELFNTAIVNTNNVLYPSSLTGTTRQALITISGNPDLTPEKALTQTYGVVLTPGFLPRFSLSIDYFRIKIKDAITTPTAQNVVDFCAAGRTDYCQFVTFNAGTNVATVLTSPLNFSRLITSGLDIEANYAHDLFGHPFSLRLLANHSIENYSQAPNATPLAVKGSATSPQWKAQMQAQYGVAGWNLFLNERFISAVKMDPNQQEGIYTDDNHVPAIFYTDITVTKDLNFGGDRRVQLFLTVENLLNQDPPVDVITPTSLTNITSPVYDRLGRYFTGGVRFKF